jgi:putative thiazole-containing bacteriocin maturation protein
MRPKLRSDTRYIPLSEGVYLRNNRSVLTIPGKHVYQWVERLAPYLDGSHALEELTDGLSADRQEMVRQLVGLLAEKGFIKDVGSDQLSTLSQAEITAYAPEIAFVEYFCDSAAARFQSFREARIVAMGSGLTLTALIQANLHVGVRNVWVFVTPECVTERAGHREYLEIARLRDPKQCLIEETVTSWDSDKDERAVRTALEPFDAVLHISDRPMLARARMLDRICLVEGKVLIQAMVVGHHAWVGPLVSPEEAEKLGGWESAWRRLQATRTGSAAQHCAFAFVNDPTAPVSEFLTTPTAALVANQLSFELFKYLTGIPGVETRSRMLHVDLETLQTQSHRFLPHPSSLALHRRTAPTAAVLVDRIRGLAQDAPFDEEDFSQRAPTCFDDALGLFTSIDEGDWHQLPLHVSCITIANPALLPDLGDPVTAVGVGTYLGMARRRALQRACEVYAASIVDERRFVQANGEGPLVWGYELTEHQPKLVPAALVFPTLCGLVPSAATAPWIASGFSWAEALSTALRSVCQTLTMGELDTRSEPFPQIDLEHVALDDQGMRYWRILQTLEVPVVAYEVTGALEVPSFAFCVGDHTVAWSTEVNARDALRSGLEQTLQYEQARANHQPGYAPPQVRDLPRRLRGSQLTLPQTGSPVAWADQQRWLCDVLKRAGRRVVAVPLDHDPAVTDVLPYLVNLVVEPR